MKKLFYLVVMVFMTVAPLSAKENVKVLYVGGASDINTVGVSNDSAEVAQSIKVRMADFSKFLKQRFTKVDIVNGKDYNPSMSEGYDVTIFDGKPEPIVPQEIIRNERGDIIRVNRAAYLPDDFSYPCICIAELSSELGKSIGSKNDWFCLCLDNYALGWKKDHPIFNGPFKVNIKSEILPTPLNAKEYEKSYGYTLPDEYEMWMVHTRATADNKLRIGMVSRPDGYLDSPDTEIISGGVCAKSIDAVAIGRHGNLFHWGFAAKPSDMTEPARAAFANAVVYMKGLKNAKMIAHKLNENIATRINAKTSKYFISRECWEAVNRINMQSYLINDSLVKAIQSKIAAGDKLTPTEEYYKSMQAPRKPEPISYSNFVRQRAPQLYPIFGEDDEEYARYYDLNTPYFYPSADGRSLEIDHDAKALKIANNDIRILDKAVALLSHKGDEAERGKRLLKRYTLCRFQTAEEWKIWLDKNREKLFFSESGGWLWLVNSDDPNEPGNDYSVLKKEGYVPVGVATTSNQNDKAVSAMTRNKPKTDKDNPVFLSAEIVDMKDGIKQLDITMIVHDGFHTYAYVCEDDPFIPTNITIELPEECEKIGELILPTVSKSSTSTTYYTGKGKFSQKFKTSGKGEAICKIHYQACDETMCLPPKTHIMKVTFD